ncbi:Na+/H+ antiporter [Clostridium bornimense]|uniref:Na+/H+ antiporter n=1 Tax=Clostridium bornimense TaxID=1216932 RepID=W6RZ38_9CLOT|nr:Na+/H+ antiporter NhaC family protein [Clostridium bornimense]CDM69743.1 Na+/H+ antiporter [Clostridium bornimense]
MKNKRRVLRTFMLILLITISMTTIALGSDGTEIKNVDRYGVLTLLPPLIAIILAFITKNVIVSLFIGLISGAFLISLVDSTVINAIFITITEIVQRMINALADPWNAGIVLQVLVIGGIIALVAKMGGAKAIAEALAKKAKGPISAQIITWILGLLVFFDDYANSLIVGPIMRPVTDKMKISREKLAFIIDATAAPISGIAIISTWVGYELTLIKDAFAAIGQEVDGFSVFLQTIPYRFYNILILCFIVYTILMKREFGSMYKAEVRARTTGKVLSNGNIESTEEHAELEPKANVKLSIWNAIIPIGVLIVGAVIGFYLNGKSIVMSGDDTAAIDIIRNSPMSLRSIQTCFGKADASIVLFQSALLASIVAIVMAASKKIFTVGEAIETWIEGMKPLIITAVILVLAWALTGVIKDLGTGDYLVSILSDKIPAFILPSIIFILGAIISFATGTAYGTMGILMPLAIPLAFSVGSGSMNLVIISASAVLTGAVFGDHCSPISDTTILSSTGAGCNHIEHVRTQMPYALSVAAISILAGYIPAALGISIWIVLPVSILLVGATVYIVGKPIPKAKDM